MSRLSFLIIRPSRPQQCIVSDLGIGGKSPSWRLLVRQHCICWCRCGTFHSPSSHPHPPLLGCSQISLAAAPTATACRLGRRSGAWSAPASSTLCGRLSSKRSRCLRRLSRWLPCPPPNTPAAPAAAAAVAAAAAAPSPLHPRCLLGQCQGPCPTNSPFCPPTSTPLHSAPPPSHPFPPAGPPHLEPSALLTAWHISAIFSPAPRQQLPRTLCPPQLSTACLHHSPQAPYPIPCCVPLSCILLPLVHFVAFSAASCTPRLLPFACCSQALALHRHAQNFSQTHMHTLPPRRRPSAALVRPHPLMPCPKLALRIELYRRV